MLSLRRAATGCVPVVFNGAGPLEIVRETGVGCVFSSVEEMALRLSEVAEKVDADEYGNSQFLAIAENGEKFGWERFPAWGTFRHRWRYPAVPPRAHLRSGIAQSCTTASVCAVASSRSVGVSGFNRNPEESIWLELVLGFSVSLRFSISAETFVATATPALAQVAIQERVMPELKMELIPP